MKEKEECGVSFVGVVINGSYAQIDIAATIVMDQTTLDFGKRLRAEDDIVLILQKISRRVIRGSLFKHVDGCTLYLFAPAGFTLTGHLS